MVGASLGILGNLDDVSLKIQNVGHDCHPLPWVFSVGLVARPPPVVVGGGELLTRYDPDEVVCFRAKL